MTSQPDSGSDSGTTDGRAGLIEKLRRLLARDNGHCGESTSERICREREQEPIRQAIEVLSSPTPAWLPVEAGDRIAELEAALQRIIDYRPQQADCDPGIPDAPYIQIAVFCKRVARKALQPLPPPPSLIGGNHE